MADTTKRTYTKKGAVLTTEHRDRKMKSYLILDGELRQISMLNGWATIFISVGSFLGATSVGIWSGLFVESSPAQTAKEYGSVVAWTFAALAGGFFMLAWRAVKNRDSDIERIKRESEEDCDV